MTTKHFLTFIFILYFFLANVELTLTIGKTKCQLTFHGLLWVMLDYYAITKYSSDDQPIKLIDFKITKNEK